MKMDDSSEDVEADLGDFIDKDRGLQETAGTFKSHDHWNLGGGYGNLQENSLQNL
jgi:hypothetical protein